MIVRSVVCRKPALAGPRTSNVKIARKCLVVRAQGSSSEGGAPATMTVDEARSLLSVTAEASFDEVLGAKNRLMRTADGNMDKQIQIETAYDLLLMESMKRRLAGDVSTAVRYADVARPKSPKAAASGAQAKAAASGSQSSGGLPNLPNLGASLPAGLKRLGNQAAGGRGAGASAGLSMPVVRPSTGQSFASQTVIFTALFLWIFLDGLPDGRTGLVPPSVPSLQLALSVAASVYFLKEQKRVGLGKAAALAIGSLLLGGVLGNVVEAWLRVDLVPLGPLASPQTVVAEGSLLLTWAATIMLA